MEAVEAVEVGGQRVPAAGLPTEVGRKLPWWLTDGFGRLFAGQAVSAVGSQVTFLALPIAAVFLLGATPAAMGILGALDNLPYLLFGLGVGVVVDRFRRRKLMIVADLVRAIAVGSVPVAFALGRLGFEQLCVVVFVVGAGNIIFDVAAQAQMPDLLARERLVAGNGTLQTATSLAAVGGPGIAGQLIAFVGAPMAIVLDSISYVVSAVFVSTIREPEAPRTRSEEPMREQIASGLRLVRADVRLVGIAGAAATISLATNALFAVFVYYLAMRAGITPAGIGSLFMAVGVAGAVGAVTMPMLAERIGAGRVLVAMPLAAGLGLAAIPAALELAPAVSTSVLVAGSLVFGLAMISFSVLSAGLRQTLAPVEARGRVLGTLRFFEWGTMPIGSLLGGAVGQVFGPVVAIELASAIFACAAIWIVASPLAGMRPAAEAPDATARG